MIENEQYVTSNPSGEVETIKFKIDVVTVL